MFDVRGWGRLEFKWFQRFERSETFKVRGWCRLWLDVGLDVRGLGFKGLNVLGNLRTQGSWDGSARAGILKVLWHAILFHSLANIYHISDLGHSYS